MMKMIVKTSASIVMIAGVMGAMTACAANDTYMRVCGDTHSKQRVSDSECPKTDNSASANDATNAYLWYYILSTNSAPAVGSSLSRGSYSVPDDDEDDIEENIPADGGDVDPDSDGVTEEEGANGSSVSEDDDDDSGSSVSDDDDDSFSGSFSDDD